MKNRRTPQKSTVLVVLMCALCFLFVHCEDDTRMLTISGTVSDPKAGTVLEDVEISLFTQKTSTGTFSFNFEEEAVTTTDADGYFAIELEFDYYTAYRLDFSKGFFFGKSVEFGNDDFGGDDSYVNDFELMPGSTLHFHIVNQNPFDANDEVKYRIKDWDGDCQECCPGIFKSFVGNSVNEEFTCNVFGGENYVIEFVTIKNGATTSPVRNVFAESFQTIDVELYY